jgi:membrane protein DedA with SNARE-associated domain
MDLFAWTISHESMSVIFIFAILLLCGVGFPVPEDIPLIALGYLWHLEQTELVIALLVGFSGVLLGDSILYSIGRKFGPELFRHTILLRIFKPKRINRAKARMRKYGLWVIFVGRFLAGFRAIIFFTAGATRVPFKKFIIVDFLAAFVSIPVWIGLGFYFGGEIDGLLNFISSSKYIALLSLLGIVVLYILIKSIASKFTDKTSG